MPLAQAFCAADWRQSRDNIRRVSAVEGLSVAEGGHTHDAEVVERALLQADLASFHALFVREEVGDARRLAGNLAAHMVPEVGGNQALRAADNMVTHEVVVRSLAAEDIDCVGAQRVIS